MQIGHYASPHTLSQKHDGIPPTIYIYYILPSTCPPIEVPTNKFRLKRNSSSITLASSSPLPINNNTAAMQRTCHAQHSCGSFGMGRRESTWGSAPKWQNFKGSDSSGKPFQLVDGWKNRAQATQIGSLYHRNLIKCRKK